MLLGCIADDLTGATDLSLTLAKEGMRTVQSTGLPSSDLNLADVDALVIALKSRSIPAEEAVAQSLDAARALRALGAEHLLFKYCSTFDSTDDGNIGPVTAALLDFVGGGPTIACPAFPQAGRTIYQGHLFVGDVLLSDSPLKDHPLNPMRDPDLRRVLARQMSTPVGLVGFGDVERGPEAIAAALRREAAAGRPVSIVDALTDRHLRDIGAALAHLPLITGGSGIAMGLPEAYHARGALPRLTPPSSSMAAPEGPCAILAGSCSAATRRQVAMAIEAKLPAFRIDADQLADRRLGPPEILAWVDRQATDRPILVYSSADPETVGRLQARLGRNAAGAMVEELLATVAKRLVADGFTRLLVAGGETSGAVVQALGVTALAIGPEIDPGVPWTRTRGGPDLALALKSGNFGGPDFFLRAWDKLS